MSQGCLQYEVSIHIPTHKSIYIVLISKGTFTYKSQLVMLKTSTDIQMDLKRNTSPPKMFQNYMLEDLMRNGKCTG